ncbi:prophage Lp2 protein 3 [Fructilactobacillus florum 8D]|uniref:site-specific DNA-methyltransferase (adenine-specific) n=1 Tax=Fructilactobacillus florum 8D TaxID=1221538 RepID=W9EDA5_9LACO|nr:DNA adenine methylase [Fructilactobacillus florum]EKK20648.1 prophage Lp2 protein 3 [Fructilactobacillus florum 2F]ETO40113.1 prophage Lp2 protein 3 [Fructilactobacillus florum 8D]
MAIKLLVDNEVDNIWINDYDKSIYSVWYSIINHPNELIKMIESVPFDYVNGSDYSDEYNLDYWNEIKEIHKNNKNHQNSIDNAFSTLLLNRMNISGIINGGPIGGKSQGKLKLYARFNKSTLIEKIKTISRLKSKIKLTRLDAEKMIPLIYKNCNLDNTFIFFDPPYFSQGKNLYMSFFKKEKHEKLAKLILSNDNAYWITTYDDNENIYNIYSKANKKYRYLINYSANNKKRGKSSELLFASSKIKLESFDKTNLIELI